MPFIKSSLSSICGVCAPLISSKICDASTELSFIACKYSRLFILLQSVQVCRFFFKIRSSRMRVALPLPSMNGWAMFISTYFLTICSMVSSGIFSMSARFSFRSWQVQRRTRPWRYSAPLFSLQNRKVRRRDRNGSAASPLPYPLPCRLSARFQRVRMPFVCFFRRWKRPSPSTTYRIRATFYPG